MDKVMGLPTAARGHGDIVSAVIGKEQPIGL
jgi:hypothetical protein